MIIPEDFKVTFNGLEHSYPNTPPGYSAPQKLYKFRYEGEATEYIWSVEPPFFIISGQGTPNITCELMPKLTTDSEKIVSEPDRLVRKEYNYSGLNIKIGDNIETLNLYYAQGPIWKIEGNRNPKLEKDFKGNYIPRIETYTLIPQYNQIGNPPKNSTDPNSYKFEVKNGKVVKFHGGIPPTGNPMIDIAWFNSGSSYLSFYSSWTNDKIKFPNTLQVYVSIDKYEIETNDQTTYTKKDDKEQWHKSNNNVLLDDKYDTNTLLFDDKYEINISQPIKKQSTKKEAHWHKLNKKNQRWLDSL